MSDFLPQQVPWSATPGQSYECFPQKSRNRRKAVSALAKEHARIANRRKDFLHQESSKLVARCGLIATEQLNVKGMTASGGAYKTGLNRSILDIAPSTFLSLLKSRAEEAGLQWIEVPTRKVKPSQTCHRCGFQRKALKRASACLRLWRKLQPGRKRDKSDVELGAHRERLRMERWTFCRVEVRNACCIGLANQWQ